MGEGGKAGKIIYGQILYHTSCSTSPHGCPIITLNLRWPRWNFRSLLPNSLAFSPQVFQILVNVPSAPAPKQRSLSFSLLYLAPFNLPASSILFPKYIQSLTSSIFFTATTMFQTTIISYIPPRFNSCPPTADCLR